MRLFLTLFILFSLPASAADSLRILLTNDDGYDAPGIRAVQKALVNAGHEVFLVAPATQQSGMGSAMTGSGVKMTEHPGNIWAVHGRPSDAVRVGLGYVMNELPPDLVVSGANLGQNVGRDTLLSGTVGAALAAHHFGFPAIAISVAVNFEERSQGYPGTVAAFPDAARMLVRLIRNLDLKDLDHGVLNVNYPAVLPLDVKGVRWSKLSPYSVYGRRYFKTKDGKYRPNLVAPDQYAQVNDAESLRDGYVTLTFLDGNMGIPPRRGQRYLERYLLDRDFTAKQPRQKKPRAIREEPQRIVAEPEPRQVVKEPQRVVAKPEPQRQVVKEPTPTLETPTHFEKRVLGGAAISTGSGEPLPDRATGSSTSDAPDTEEVESQETRKKKPDSWLRRIFDPKSWRN